jgi:hypothetical protein
MVSPLTFTATVPAAPPRILWVGPSDSADLRLARGWAGELAVVHDAATPQAAVAAPPADLLDRSPAVILLAADAPTRWCLDDVLEVAIRWPLAPIVAVASSLMDGRRRSGPSLPGVEDVPWYDLPGRLACWLADRAVGRPGTLGIPATARREDRFLAAATGRPPFPGTVPATVSAAAGNAVDLEGLVDLLAAAGAAVGRRIRGRPPLDDPSPALVWDVGRLAAEELAWLRMLAANRPGLRIVVLESFPRPNTTLAALQAGAAAVLGRPASAEALAGTLARIGTKTGLSSTVGPG